jgi:hypothetical protein
VCVVWQEKRAEIAKTVDPAQPNFDMQGDRAYIFTFASSRVSRFFYWWAYRHVKVLDKEGAHSLIQSVKEKSLPHNAKQGM